MTASPVELVDDQLAYFRFGRVAGKVLVTNDAGDWDFLDEQTFADLLGGRIGADHPRYGDLQRKGFLRNELDLAAFAERMVPRVRHVCRGPGRHIVTVTMRRSGNLATGAAEDAVVPDMTPETAESIVDFALLSTASSLTFELRGGGGEPLLNFETVQHLIDYARSRNRQAAGKTLRFEIHSDLSAMRDEAAEWLIANEVAIATTFDGPASVHDGNRQALGGSSHETVSRWMDYFRRRVGELGLDPSQRDIEAHLRVTRHTLEAWREVVDEYAARGLRSIALRPLVAAYIDEKIWATIGYGIEDYLAFYRRTLDYILELNRRGTDLRERLASRFLTKMLTAKELEADDIQSPNGAGSRELAYHVDGRIFPSEEARLIGLSGDPIFELGHVRDMSVEAVVRHPTVRAIAAASLLEAQPMCADCWNKPFCGFSPVRNFATHGDLFGQRPRCFECKEHMAVAERLFQLLADDGDTATAAILRRWTAS